jgi:gas vesicle protein
MFFKKKKKSLEKKKDTSIVMGLIVGGAIGSVISLLFAPDSGKNTRKKVAKKGRDVYEKSKTQAELFLEKYNKQIKEKISHKKDNTNDKI